MRVAAIATIYHPKSHADVIATKFMKGMSTDEGLMPPEVDLVSLYIDHVLENDIGVGSGPRVRGPHLSQHPPRPARWYRPAQCRCSAAHRRARRLPLERAGPPHVPAPLFL